ncbi:unnamed protein product [[Candida] boidinii]|nr:unnamed protein product [[Candida] boidinii]
MFTSSSSSSPQLAPSSTNTLTNNAISSNPNINSSNNTNTNTQFSSSMASPAVTANTGITTNANSSSNNNGYHGFSNINTSSINSLRSKVRYQSYFNNQQKVSNNFGTSITPSSTPQSSSSLKFPDIQPPQQLQQQQQPQQSQQQQQQQIPEVRLGRGLTPSLPPPNAVNIQYANDTPKSPNSTPLLQANPSSPTSLSKV